MNRANSIGLDDLTAEYLQHCHSLLPGVLARLFNWFVWLRSKFQHSLDYTLPVLKVNNSGKNITVDDFQGSSLQKLLSVYQ